MHDKSPTTSQGYGMTPHFIPICHFCGVDGYIRPNYFRYIKKCRVESMMERNRLRRANMHVPRKSRVNNPRNSSNMLSMTIRNENVSPRWMRKDEPACYDANISPISSTRSNGLGRSIGPYALH